MIYYNFNPEFVKAIVKIFNSNFSIFISKMPKGDFFFLIREIAFFKLAELYWLSEIMAIFIEFRVQFLDYRKRQLYF